MVHYFPGLNGFISLDEVSTASHLDEKTMKKLLALFIGILCSTAQVYSCRGALLQQDLIDSLKGYRYPPPAEGILRALDQGPKLYASGQFQKLNELLDAAAVLRPERTLGMRLMEYYLMLGSETSARKLLKWLKGEYGAEYEYGLYEAILDVNSDKQPSMDWESARFLLENWMHFVLPDDLAQMLPRGEGPSATKATAYVLLGRVYTFGESVPMFSNFALRQALAADPLNPVITYALANQIWLDFQKEPKLRKTKLLEAISILKAALPRVRGDVFKKEYLSLLARYEREIR